MDDYWQDCQRGHYIPFKDSLPNPRNSSRSGSLFATLQARIHPCYTPRICPIKKSAKPPKATLDKILSTINRGFAAVAEDITEIKSTMATKANLATVKTELKGDIAALGEQLTAIEATLKAIRKELDDLQDKFENVSGFRKEIDHALDRIAAIEKHLGINKKIAA
jgi:septal ring factor EnvC (AmiA/AmiB activator)